MKEGFGLISKFSRPILAFYVIISIFSAVYSFKFLTINTSTESLINENLNFKKNQDELREKFPILANNLLIRISGDDRKILEQETIDIIKTLKTKKLNFVYSPTRDKFFKDNFFSFLTQSQREEIINKLFYYQPFFSELNKNPKLQGFNNLIELSLKDTTDNEKIKNFELIFDKFNQSLISREKVDWENLFNSRQFEYIILGLDRNYLLENKFKTFYDFLRKLSESKENIKIEFTGGLLIDHEEISSVSEGASKSGLLSLFLVSIVLWIGIRKITAISFLMFSVVVGLSVTIGLTTFFIGHLNLISVAFAVLFIGLSVDFGIQVYLRIIEDSDRSLNNVDKEIKNIRSTLIIASIPSMIGFLSFIPTDYIGLSELGRISFIGLLVGLTVNITFLPALFITFPKSINYRENKNVHSFSGLNSMIKSSQYYLISIIIVITLFTFYAIKKINFDSDALNLKDQNLNSVKLAKELIEENPTSDYIISLIIDKNNENSEKLNRLVSSENIKSIFSYEDFSKRYESEELEYFKFLILSEKSNSFFSKKEELQRFKLLLNKIINLKLYDGITQNAENLLEKLNKDFSNNNDIKELEELLFKDFEVMINKIEKFGVVEESFLEKIPKYYSDRYISQDNLERVEIFPSKDVTKKQFLQDFVLDVQKIFPKATGMPVVQYEAGSIVIKSFITAMILSIIFLVLFVFFIFKKLLLVFICIFPLFISSILTLFFMIICKLNFNFANMIALPLLYSLGITYCIYFVKRYLEFGNLESVFRSNTPKAIIYSALTTIASFGTLAISSHNGTSSMGILLFISLFSTLISSVLYLPMLLEYFKKRIVK